MFNISPAHIRTAVPVAVGSILGWLMIHVSFASSFFTTLDHNFGSKWRGGVATVVTGAVIFIYYALARWLGRKYPKLEKILLGSDKTPTYNGK